MSPLSYIPTETYRVYHTSFRSTCFPVVSGIYIYIKYTRKQGKSNFLEYSTVKFNLVVSIAKTLCFKLIVQRPRWHLVQYTFSSNNLYTIKTQSCEYNIKYTYYKG